ncbi:TIGR01841 family phasin [Undibacterium sp. WLHG33]|uniref:phasin family protein n=1 Tax=Undibacterium sp. WLHG33 TaxID=3412482 RepID=UPI003C2B5EFA
MALIQTQISVVAQEQLSKQLELLQSFSDTAFQGLEKMIALNFATIRDAVDKVTASSRQVLSSNGPQELFALAQTQRQPQIDSLLAYGKELATISSDTREAFLHLANADNNHLISVHITKTEVAPVVAEKSLNASPASKKKVSPAKVKSISGTKQISLLPETDVKISTVKVSADKKIVSQTTTSSKKATIPASKAKPAVKAGVKASSTPAVSATSVKAAGTKTKATAPKTVKKTITAQAEATSATAVTEVQPVSPAAAVPATPAPIKEAVAPENTTPAVSPEVAVTQKKSAVKFPFPPTKNLQGDKPAFPQAGGRPAYKGKASPATGAKKRVRQ